MKKLENNISIFDAILSVKGEITDLISFAADNSIEVITEDLSNNSITYSDNLFSQNLMFDNKLISTKNRDLYFVTQNQFNNDFNNDFKI